MEESSPSSWQGLRRDYFLAWAQYLVHVLDSALLWPASAPASLHQRETPPGQEDSQRRVEGAGRSRWKLGSVHVVTARQELQRLQAQHDALHGKLQDRKDRRVLRRATQEETDADGEVMRGGSVEVWSQWRR